MNIFNTIEEKVKSIIETEFRQDTKNIAVQSPKDEKHGDMAVNAAMVLAKPMKMKPRDIAQQLVPKISEIEGVDKVEIAGAGFINITFNNSFWQQQINNILSKGLDYGSTNLGGGEKVNVEYASPNPTGPMHIGHARGAVYGDILANLLSKMGYNVTREFYQNDAGGQIDTLTKSVYLRYKEALGEEIEIPEGLYPGEYLKPIGEELAKEYGDSLLNHPPLEGGSENPQDFSGRGQQFAPPPQPSPLKGEGVKSHLGENTFQIIKKFAVSKMMDLIREDLACVGIHHDVFTSEQALRDAGMVEEALDTLEKKGLIYQGIPEKPQSEKATENWQPLEQTLFKSSQFGDDKDRVVKKNDGGWTYFTPDIAYNYDKFKRGHKHMFLILGVDHSGYVKRLKAAVSAISDGEAKIDIILCQLVKFMDGGQPLKMSKRAGTFVELRDVVERIGKDVIRFMMLTRKNDAPLDFDLQKAVEQSKDNPVFYVQYAHARCQSVLRKVLYEGNHPPLEGGAKNPQDFSGRGQPCEEKLICYPPPENLSDKSLNFLTPPQGGSNTSLLSCLNHPAEISLIKKMCEFPRIMEAAAKTYEPHRIAFYLEELAGQFHALWNLGNDEPELRFIIEGSPELTQARLTLVKALASVIACGLAVMGVEPVDEMR